MTNFDISGICDAGRHEGRVRPQGPQRQDCQRIGAERVYRVQNVGVCAHRGQVPALQIVHRISALPVSRSGLLKRFLR